MLRTGNKKVENEVKESYRGEQAASQIQMKQWKVH